MSHERDARNGSPIAVIGIGALFPGSTSALGFWRDILEGRDRMSEVPPSHWPASDYVGSEPGPDRLPHGRGAFVPEVEFAPVEYGLPPNILPATDTAQLLALVVARQALEDAARGRPDAFDRSRTSVILGVGSATEMVGQMSGRLQIPIQKRALRKAGADERLVAETGRILEETYLPWQENTFPGLLGNVVAGRVANRFDLGGTNAVVDAACASSLAAIRAATNELVLGQADVALSGGVDALNDILMFMCFAQTGALSPSGDCRPYSDEADGTMLGEGVGMVVLKRLADAERDGDAIYAVIRGIGSSSDGRAKSIYAPLAKGQTAAIRRAYAEAGYGPDTVDLVEGHGTATRAGDAAEVEALHEVFAEAGAAPGRCALGSVKSQIGHTKAAAGSAGLIKAVLALHHKVLPPTIKVSRPGAALGLEGSPFYLNTQVRPWVRRTKSLRRAGVSSLGFGGTNFHVTVEEYCGPVRPRRMHVTPSELLVLAADDRPGLARACRALAERCTASGALPHAARRTQLAYEPAAALRLAIVATDEEDARQKLERVAASLEGNGEPRLPPGREIRFGEGACQGDVAFLFPGQGSQHTGMTGDLAIHFEAALEVWNEAAAVVREGDTTVADLVFPPPTFSETEREESERRLTATEWTQPAVTAATLSLLAILRRLEIRPDRVAGHSLGEVAALCAAGSIDASAALRIARKRGELMAAAARRPGGMTAVSAGIDVVAPLVERLSGAVVIANHNAPGQVVLSGGLPELEALEASLREAGPSFRRLPVGTAFHSPLVEEASEPFLSFLAGISLEPPRLPVHGHDTGEPYAADVGELRERLALGVVRPVRFVDQMEALYAAGAQIFVEVGPRAVLTGLAEQCLAGRPHVTVALARQDRHGVTALQEGLAQLVAAGVPIRFEALWADRLLPQNPAERVPPKFSVRIGGANYGKPALPEGGGQPTASARPVHEWKAAASPEPPAPTPPQRLEPAAPVPVAPVPVMNGAAPAPVAFDASWLEALGRLQAPAIAAQLEYQRLMAESHAAFLRAIEVSYTAHLPGANGSSLMGGRPVAIPGGSIASAPAPDFKMAPPPAFEPLPLPLPLSPATVSKEIVSPPGVGAALTPEPTPLVETGTAQAGPAMDLEGLVVATVAEKTGYPLEMIDRDMDLEADLGIDSIKRVEILSAVRDRVPGLPDVDAARLGTLRTLAAIIAELRRDPASSAPSAPAPAEERTRSAPTARSGQPAALPPVRDNAIRGLGVGEAPTLRRRVLRVVPATAPGFAGPGLGGTGSVIVTPSGDATQRVLVEEMLALGIPAVAVERVSGDARTVVFLGGLRPVSSLEDGLAVNREGFETARVVAARFREAGGTLVCVQDAGGDFGLSGRSGARAVTSGLTALARTARAEWPEALVRAIDVQRGSRDARDVALAILHELLNGGLDPEIALGKDGARYRLNEEESECPPGEAVPSGAVFLVTAGARGVTAACIEELARLRRPRLALIGRTVLEPEPAEFAGLDDPVALKRAAIEAARAAGEVPAPREIDATVAQLLAGREVHATLSALKAAGSPARYFAADVRDNARLAEIVADVRTSWGPIQGIVHGAGVLADAWLDRKTDEQFQRVMETKVLGLQALLEAVRDEPVRWLCLFSSVAARAGNAGQSDYAMANEILNRMAAVEARRREGSCRVVSIGWGPWDGGMVTPALRGHFHSRGVPLLPLDAGAGAFVREIESTGAEVDVVVCMAASGGAPGDAGAGAPLRAEIAIGPATHPHFLDHRVNGTVVLPMVAAIEWLARAAHSRGHANGILRLADVRVVRGVTMDDFERQGTGLTLTCGALSQEGTPLELRDAQGGVRYAARLEPVIGGPEPGIDPAALELRPCPRGSENIYGSDALFQGPAFHVIRKIEGSSPMGMSALIATTGETPWPIEPWRTEPALLEGALQLACLAAWQRIGCVALPLRIERIDHHAGAATGPVRCLLRVRDTSTVKLVADATLIGADHRQIASIVGIELYAVPTGAEA